MAGAERAAASILHGEHRQRKAGGGERFWQFREYYPGDRPQDIDWRQSGKTDRVFIRQKEWQTNQSAFLWCSQAPGMDFKSTDAPFSKADSARIITLAIGLLLTHGGEEIGLFGTQRKGRSEAALQYVAAALMEKSNREETLPQGDVYKNSALFLSGDFLDPPDEISEHFKMLSAHSASGFVIQILDPAEINLPYDGRAVFEMPNEKKQRELVNNVASIRAEYNARIAAHIKAVQTISHDCGWNYVLHSTDNDIKDTLLEIWTTLTLHNSGTGTVRR